MNNYKLSKDELEVYLKKGMSSRDIEKVTGIKYWNILNYIKQYGLNNTSNYKKLEYDDNFFNKIDTKEKAYTLGFMLADGCLSNDDKFTINVSLSDREILDFMVSNIGGRVRENHNKDVKKKIFPYATIKIGNNKIIKDIKMLFGGRLKEERHIPIIKKDLELFLLQGFFDADGCITWGYRKDRDRIWQKISFTSQYKLLLGIQSILIKYGVSSIIRPKQKEKCFILETCNKSEVLKMLNLIYSDEKFIVLNRKYEKSKALRLELGEFGESSQS